ncbi:hypothetical protein OEV98_04045 [Caldibacillus lycopersici]|uniref:Uncharacterized protein n=1 Tax=Perspicuibacillus lycopersici TaxID=1325689 RepID=A0AAE3IQU4_9BACI|nr:hypothetical protein [Perspicuibacillus lycopersici]MCU9612736.1 hypothetical protein [Perspicuibacillus lycopersici]
MGFWAGFFTAIFLGKSSSESDSGGCAFVFLIFTGLIGLVAISIGSKVFTIIAQVYDFIKNIIIYLYSLDFIQYLLYPSTFDIYHKLEINPFFLGILFFFILYYIMFAVENLSDYFSDYIIRITYPLFIIGVINYMILFIRAVCLICYGSYVFISDSITNWFNSI